MQTERAKAAALHQRPERPLVEVIEVVSVIQTLEGDVVAHLPEDAGDVVGNASFVVRRHDRESTGHEYGPKSRRESLDISHVLDRREGDSDVPSTIAEVDRVEVCAHDLDAVDLRLKRRVEPGQERRGLRSRRYPKSSPRPAPMSITAASRLWLPIVCATNSNSETLGFANQF